MIFKDKHIAVLGRLFLLLFVIASSGFTIVLSNCLMGTPDCCATMCQESAPSSREVSVHSQIGCSKSIVVGGLNTIPGLVEKSVKLQNNRHEVFSVTTSILFRQVQSDNIIDQITSYSSSSSPPSVEKYVLYSSFLI